MTFHFSDFKYNAIMKRSRPAHAPQDGFSVRHPVMSLRKRAKIFKPFEALRGFGELLPAQQALVERRLEQQINRGLSPVELTTEPTTELTVELTYGENVMCTRFYIDISDKELQDIVSTAAGSALAHRFMVAGDPMATSGEIFPTNVTAVIASSRTGQKSVFPMKWGYEMRRRDASAKAVSMLLNARVETAAAKPTFRDSWRSHRCIVPASYYFEWNADKQKYAIQPRGFSITWLCGLYRVENGFPHFVILTRDPGDEIRAIHDRMPLILPQNRIDDWINPNIDAATVAQHSLSEMFYEKAV